MSEKISDLDERINLLISQKRWSEVIPETTKLINLTNENPGNQAEAYQKRGFAYNWEGNFDQAISDFNKAIELRPDSADAYQYRGVAHIRKRDYAQAAPDFSKLIELDPENASAYLQRGIACVWIGDYDSAFSDLDRTIDLDPQNAFAYLWRGVAHTGEDDDELAIADFGKAIELDSKNVYAYLQRGTAYTRRGDDELAVVDFDKAIELDPKDANAYLFRGVIHGRKGNHAPSISDLKKTLELDPENADAYFFQGMVHIMQGNHDRAIEDFDRAVQFDPENTYHPVAYIALQIKDIYSEEKADRAKFFRLYLNLFGKVNFIQEKLFCKPQELEVAHYTSLHVLKSMIGQEGRFRLYNAAYMNDPEEGRVFFELMRKYQGLEKIEGLFYEDNENGSHLSPAYIGSFIGTRKSDEDDSEPQQKDKLFLWRTYGKHDEDEAAGSCLIFDRLCFAEKHQAQIWGAPKLSSISPLLGNRVSIEENVNVDIEARLSIYKVNYQGPKYENGAEISLELDELAGALNEIKNCVSAIESDKQRIQLKALVRQLLDSIRFLFKASHYKEENEIRIIDIRYYDKNGMRKSDGIKVDADSIPPKFYIEAPKSVRFSEIILGPKARHIEEWKAWIKEQDEKVRVKKSKIPYGGPVS